MEPSKQGIEARIHRMAFIIFSIHRHMETPNSLFSNQCLKFKKVLFSVLFSFLELRNKKRHLDFYQYGLICSFILSITTAKVPESSLIFFFS